VCCLVYKAFTLLCLIYVAYLGYLGSPTTLGGEVVYMAKEFYQENDEKYFSPSPESGSLESNIVGIAEPIYDDTVTPRASVPRRMLESFKRDPSLRATPKGVVGANGKVFDVEAAALATAESPLARKLKGRHLQMIAIGGSIGML